MSGDETFLERWSRRKRAAQRPAEPESPAGTGGAAPEAPASNPDELPPIESINAASDLAPFLAPGVSAALTRAALRRAWTADPAIREFIGLSENAWDFTSDGVPGFGALAADDVKRLLAALTREADAAEPTEAPSPAPMRDPPEPEPPLPNNAALQKESPEEKPAGGAPTRRHGGALPQ